MKKSKIIFIILSIIFLCVIMYFVYDFSKKTKFPGNADKKHEEGIQKDRH